MVIENNNGDNKIFIDESIIDHQNCIVSNTDPTITKINLEPKFEINIMPDNTYLLFDCTSIIYDKANDTIYFYANNETMISKDIKENEIASISIDDNVVSLEIIKLPNFMFGNNIEDKYPKFEVNLSDCVYSMKIYLNESEYIDIPLYQSHITIHETLDYISSLVYFLEETPDFLKSLCNSKELQLSIYKKDEMIACETYYFKLEQNGIALMEQSEEPDIKIVDYHKFFKLIMDGIWEVDFYE